MLTVLLLKCSLLDTELCQFTAFSSFGEGAGCWNTVAPGEATTKPGWCALNCVRILVLVTRAMGWPNICEQISAIQAGAMPFLNAEAWNLISAGKLPKGTSGRKASPKGGFDCQKSIKGLVLDAVRTDWRAVKCLDPIRTAWGESKWQVPVCSTKSESAGRKGD